LGIKRQKLVGGCRISGTNVGHISKGQTVGNILLQLLGLWSLDRYVDPKRR